MSVWFVKIIRDIIWKVILSGEETQPVLREKKNRMHALQGEKLL
jgi:hypothetical protein